MILAPLDPQSTRQSATGKKVSSLRSGKLHPISHNPITPQLIRTRCRLAPHAIEVDPLHGTRAPLGARVSGIFHGKEIFTESQFGIELRPTVFCHAEVRNHTPHQSVQFVSEVGTREFGLERVAWFVLETIHDHCEFVNVHERASCSTFHAHAPRNGDDGLHLGCAINGGERGSSDLWVRAGARRGVGVSVLALPNLVI